MNTYELLAPVAGINSFTINNSCPFGAYLGSMISIFLGIIAALAMLMIILGGIQYMGSELISSKQEAKNRIFNSVIGLLIALGSWLILDTINPKLLELCLNLAKTPSF